MFKDVKFEIISKFPIHAVPLVFFSIGCIQNYNHIHFYQEIKGFRKNGIIFSVVANLYTSESISIYVGTRRFKMRIGPLYSNAPHKWRLK